MARFLGKTQKRVFKGKSMRIQTLSSNRYWIAVMVFYRDKLGRKWASGIIKMSRELVNEKDYDHVNLICEMANERFNRGLSWERKQKKIA